MFIIISILHICDTYALKKIKYIDKSSVIDYNNIVRKKQKGEINERFKHTFISLSRK